MPIDAPDPIAGMAGVADFNENERPQSWRQGLLYQEPAGEVSLTALTAVMSSFRIKDYKHTWFSKNLPPRRGDATDIYTNAALTSTYSSGGAVGDVVYVKLSEDHAARFRYSNLVMVTVSTDASAFVVTKQIAEPVLNGANSYLTLRLLEADDNSTAPTANDMSNADGVVIMGNSNPQGSLRPRALGYKTTELFNFTHIWRNSMNLTRTRMQTLTRIGDPYDIAKKEAMREHMLDIEWSLFMSERSMSENTDNGEIETTTRGLVNWIKTEAPENYVFFNYDQDPAFAGTTFAETGWKWLRRQIELSFRYTSGNRQSDSKLVYCGNLALLHLQEAIETVAGNGFMLVENQLSFGIKVMTLITPFGVWHLKRHPLFVHEPMMNYALVVVEPSNLNWAFIDDTTFDETGRAGRTSKGKRGEGGYDGVEGDFLTEAMLELHYPNTFMFCGGIGLDNNTGGGTGGA